VFQRQAGALEVIEPSRPLLLVYGYSLHIQPSSNLQGQCMTSIMTCQYG
jgi:hypothetical protein